MTDFLAHISGEEFIALARHPNHPHAFTRQRKLPLPRLLGVLMSFRGGAVQSELDAFFANLSGSACLVHGVCDRALAQARAKIHVPALYDLNEWLVQRAHAAGVVQRWQGLRVVCGDASVLYPARRACHRTRSLAPAQQYLFGLFLPGGRVDAGRLGAWGAHGRAPDAVRGPGCARA